jgi:ATP-dependent Clp protease ATP-binding subunit ClpA
VEFEEQIETIKKEEEDRRKRGDNVTEGKFNALNQLSSNNGFESAAVTEIRQKIEELNKAAAANKAEFESETAKINEHLILTNDLIVAEFSSISGIDVSKLNEDDRIKLKNLAETLNQRIFGQHEAVRRLSDAVKVARTGKKMNNRPQASFMFLGPSGVGKTEIAKALAVSLFGDEGALMRFDMSEYMEKHAVAKMIGAPPGYEGFEAGGILTNAARKFPNRIYLFDEIEKAHPDVFNIFLQILSDGRLTDNVGRTVSFADAIIIMTTNIGQPIALDPDLTWEEIEAGMKEELDKTYRSEFLNRFAGRQNIVCFKKLELEHIENIVRREIKNLNITYGEMGVEIEISDKSLKAFCRDHYDPKIGARGLPGYIQANLEPTIVNTILDTPDASGTMIVEYNEATKAFDISMNIKESLAAA